MSRLEINTESQVQTESYFVKSSINILHVSQKRNILKIPTYNYLKQNKILNCNRYTYSKIH